MLLDEKSFYYCDWSLWMKVCVFGNIYFSNKKLIKYRFHQKNTIAEIAVEKFKNELFFIKIEGKKIVLEFGEK